MITLTHCGLWQSHQKDSIENILHGSISYPFALTPAIGQNMPKEKFVIRTIQGSTEYVVEIPGAAEEYDVVIPMAAIGGDREDTRLLNSGLSPAATDRDVTSEFPKMSQSDPLRNQFIDKAFGVGETDGPSQSPSYTLGLARINKLYRKKEFEHALIEIDHLLTYYPNSPKLLKMRGSVLIKLQEWVLAEKAWLKALQLTPHDKVLQKGIHRLKKKVSRLTADLDRINEREEVDSIPDDEDSIAP